jgi:hypothetical protein
MHLRVLLIAYICIYNEKDEEFDGPAVSAFRRAIVEIKQQQTLDG